MAQDLKSVSGPNRLSASQAAQQIREGALSAAELMQACLERIGAREDERRAWAYIDPDQAMAAAEACDRAPKTGPLAGVPIGIKDIIDTADMPTEFGSPIYRNHQPACDASCVGLLRMAGAIVLGKTVTCEFAGSFAGPTTNPHNPRHSPGGSSSGSAAAVADFMVPVALGTQTGGSVLRPSAYCGIVGYKPGFDTFNLGGVKPAAQSLDTLGIHARTLEDVELLTACLIGRPVRALEPPKSTLRIGFCRTPLWDAAQPETVSAMEDAASRLTASGAELREIDLPGTFAGLNAAREKINAYERARLMAYEWTHHRDALSDHLRGVIGEGHAMAYDDYVAAITLGEHCRAQIPKIFSDLDLILAPAANGEAPEGLASTGDARFQGIWTFMHLPAITLPTHRSAAGLPVGIQ
ncbi:MAG: amidase, partial [Rhizobiales bacterium]|nr:amidase [Hyphomicrobiales bacterium]